MQFDMARAWKDEEYRQDLSQEQQTQLAESPVGEVELSEAELEQISGTGGYGGAGGAGGVGNGVYKSDYGFSAFGVKNNSYFCGNYSYQPRTNLNLGEKTGSAHHGGILQSITSEIESRVSTSTSTRVNRFDFSCSMSGGLAGACIFGGK